MKPRPREQIVALSMQWQGSHARRERPKHAHAADLIEQVAFWHGCTALDIYGDSRWTPIFEARLDAYAAVLINCRLAGRQLNYCDMARYFGKHRTTIMSGLAHRGLHAPLPRQARVLGVRVDQQLDVDDGRVGNAMVMQETG